MISRRVLVLAVVAAMLLPPVGAGGNGAPAGRAGTQLVFVHLQPNGATRIWAANPDGTNARALTHDLAATPPNTGTQPSDSSPAASPDGQEVAFIRTPAQNCVNPVSSWCPKHAVMGLLILQIATGHIRRLTPHLSPPSNLPGPHVTAVDAWSPDGRSIYATALRSPGCYTTPQDLCQPGIMKITVADGRATWLILPALDSSGNVAFAGNGTELAYSHQYGVVQTVSLRNGLPRRTSPPQPVAQIGRIDITDFALSTTGRIAVIGTPIPLSGPVAKIPEEVDPTAAYIVTPAGHLRKVSGTLNLAFGHPNALHWSPDSRSLIMVYADPGNGGWYPVQPHRPQLLRIGLRPTGTTTAVQILDLPGDNTDPNWLP